MATPAARAALKRPNVLITGTPGTGKTTTAAAIAVRRCLCMWVGWGGWVLSASVSPRLLQAGLGREASRMD